MALPKVPKNGADDDATGEDITKNREELQKSLREGQNRTTVAVTEGSRLQSEHLKLINDQIDNERARAGAELEASREAKRKATIAGAGDGGTGGKAPKLGAGGKMGGMFGALAGFVGAVGKGAGMLLRGIAMGLAAFANPAVLIGAGALGLSILAIGVGVAGAAWITGKALPTFTKGLKGFEDLDELLFKKSLSFLSPSLNLDIFFFSKTLKT